MPCGKRGNAILESDDGIGGKVEHTLATTTRRLTNDVNDGLSGDVGKRTTGHHKTAHSFFAARYETAVLGVPGDIVLYIYYRSEVCGVEGSCKKDAPRTGIV